jgi:excisionase family DNA binding protein
MTTLVLKPARSAENADPHFAQLLDTDEAAALLKIHPKTLQQMARNSQITGIRIGKLWRVRASVLNAWLEQKIAS